MRIRKDKMIKAIDGIIADHDKRKAAWEKGLVTWEKERRQRWLREEKPKFGRLSKLITDSLKGGGVLTHEQVKEIFGVGRYDNIINLTPYQPDLMPNSPITLNSGQKLSKPTGVDIQQMQAMKKLLEAIEDDVVTDHALAKLGVKNVTPIFRAAVELGGLVA